jgi:SAM-dependent methyltransferase
MRLLKVLLEKLAYIEAGIAMRWAASSHRRLMLVQWGLPPKPQYFDHHIDLFYQWIKTRDAMWLERGVFSALALNGGNVLELSCGDGFNARNFYSLRANKVLAVDIDPDAISLAIRKNSAPNIIYKRLDITSSLPCEHFDNVIWDFGFPLLEYFTESEVDNIFKNIKKILCGVGVFSGYTLAQNVGVDLPPEGKVFLNKEDLQNFLLIYFDKVIVFETKSPNRLNLYFWASDNLLPFDD